MTKTTINVLVIGNGGREHALAWKATQCAGVKKVFVAPGNAGTALESNVENVAIDILDFAKLTEFAKMNNVQLTIVGPEIPLVNGIVDYFEAEGLRCFGPTKLAAQLEGSKAFSKDFLARHNIPTAAYQSFTQTAPAIEYIKKIGAPIVIKADGLAAGKGVILAQKEQEAISAVTDMLQGNVFGEAGNRVVIEEFLYGEEASFIVMVDGTDVVAFATSQDHKARDDGDQGPNTGGMGAYSPAPVVTPEIHQRVMENIIYPTVKGMLADGIRYRGFLYAGLMIDTEGNAKVLEFNCRFGDPETQPIMMRMKSDLVALCIAACDGQLAGKNTEWDKRAAIGIVMAAGGYPDTYKKGYIISGLPEGDMNTKTFQAGTRLDENGQVLTNGGRVLCVTALGKNVTQAQQNAYQQVNQIHWENAYYRKDIGYRAIEREQKR